MTVYCVCYSNAYEGTYAPQAVFSTEELAQEYIKSWEEATSNHGEQDAYVVEEYELNGELRWGKP